MCRAMQVQFGFSFVSLSFIFLPMLSQIIYCMRVAFMHVGECMIFLMILIFILSDGVLSNRDSFASPSKISHI